MAKVIRIQAVPGVTGGRFCRGGRCFGTQPTELREGELTAEQLEAIQAEPMLVVEITDEVEPTKPQAKAEADPKGESKKPEDAKPADQAPAGGQGEQTGSGQAAPAAQDKVEAKPAAQPKQAAKPADKPAAKEGGK